MADADELIREQTFFDRAFELREEFRESHRLAPGGAVRKLESTALKRTADAVQAEMGSPSEAVAIGRMDFDNADTLYVGRYPIWDEGDVVVVSWKSDVSRAYYEASPADSKSLSRRRRYTTDGNRVLDFEEIIFADLNAELQDLADYSIPDSLLDDLQRNRTGEMQDIVRTIQAEQSRIMREEPDQLMVVQGGPGTGKTAIGLHRASWILFNSTQRIGASDLLVIGPSRTFVRYINRVLPGLGDRDVRQLPVTALGPEVRIGGSDPVETAGLKGDLRIRTLIDKALDDRISNPQDGLTFTVMDRPQSIERRAVAESLKQLRLLPYADGRARFREYLRTTVGFGPGEGGDALDSAVESIWPQLTPQSFLRDLFGSEPRLVTAAGDDFSAADVRRLYRRRAERLSEEQWSIADLPLLDYADWRISGEGRQRYAHIIIDEVQDLSPMQLDSISRRSSNGAYTVIGDLAQSTGPWARTSWDEVVSILDKGLPSKVTELEIGYRVPKQIFDFAKQLLPWSAPMIRPPESIREGPSDPELLSASEYDRGARTAAAARQHAGFGLSVGIICPGVLRSEISEALSEAGMNWTDAGREGEIGSTITLVAPLEAKGLEFDAVVVVEPEEIVAEDPQGLRLLYVALTRATKHLSVVHVGRVLPIPEDPEGDLGPIPLSPEVEVRTEPQVGTEMRDQVEPAGERLARLVATDLAGQVRASIVPGQWGEVLRILEEELRLDPGD